MTEKFVKSNYDFYIQVNSSVFNLNIDFIKKMNLIKCVKIINRV